MVKKGQLEVSKMDSDRQGEKRNGRHRYQLRLREWCGPAERPNGEISQQERQQHRRCEGERNRESMAARLDKEPYELGPAARPWKCRERKRLIGLKGGP